MRLVSDSYVRRARGLAVAMCGAQPLRRVVVGLSVVSRPKAVVATLLLIAAGLAFTAIFHTPQRDSSGQSFASGVGVSATAADVLTTNSVDRDRNFASRVLHPSVTGVLPLDAKGLAALNDSLRVGSDDTFSLLLHAVAVYGPTACVSSPACGGEVGLTELALDSDLSARHFGGFRALCKTRYGARFPLVHKTLAHVEVGAEAHPGQALAVLAASGADLATPLSLPGGESGELRLVLDDLLANFSLDGELYWDAVALSLLLPPAQTNWTNKFAQSFSFDDLANELIARPETASACLGIHRLISLTVLYRADRERPILTEAARGRVSETLALAVQRLCSSQAEDGSWSYRWSQEAAKQVSQFAVSLPEDPMWHVVATGHHLEWLVLLPPELAPPTSVYRRAGSWLYNRLMQQIDDREWAKKLYCPVSHAVRCLNVLNAGDRLNPDRL
ncbi:MAG TPA: hypothetical protein VMV10_22610 [Pirellulales bacterium]|nr:hypothetical protein [Pirellulales bacterium]